jgi:hypothetical protein
VIKAGGALGAFPRGIKVAALVFPLRKLESLTKGLLISPMRKDKGRGNPPFSIKRCFNGTMVFRL